MQRISGGIPSIALAATLCLFALACDTPAAGGLDAGSDTSDVAPDSAQPGTLTVGQFPAAFVAAYCAYATRCVKDFKALASPDSCPALTMAESAPYWAELQQAVQDGVVTFDGAQAAACLTAMAARICDLAVKAPASCSAMFVGSLADGQPCTDGAWCASTYCSRPPGTPDGCPSTCAPLGQAGSPCQSLADCAGDLYCVAAQCTAVSPPQPAAKGQPCQEYNVPCTDGLYCAWGRELPVCVQQVGPGQACSDAFDCRRSLTCDEETGKCPPFLKEGDACQDPTPFAEGPSQCADGLICAIVGSEDHPEALCKPLRTLGESCEGDYQCAALDAGCFGGKCKLLPGKGEPCTPTQMWMPCQQGLGCSATALVCLEPGAAGKPCVAGDCGAGLTCDDNNLCQPDPTLGEACTWGCAYPYTCSEAGKCVAPLCPAP